MKLVVPITLLLTALSSSSLAAPQGDAKALQGAADRAVVRERFCDAAYLYRKLDEMKPTAETLIAASEAAAGGGDRAGALRFLETFQSRHAGHRLAAGVATKVEALRAAVAKYGAGSTCVDPPAECGNGAFEPGEDCDDGNRVDADTCPGSCTVAAAPTVSPPAPGVPKTPVKPEPVKPEPVKPEPVKPEPVKAEPVKAEPVKAEPVKAEPVKPEPVNIEPVKPEPEPVRAPDLETDEEEADEEAPVQPKADDEEPKAIRSIDDEAEPAGGGSPIAGIALGGIGGLMAVGGGVAVGFGLIPLINYAGKVNEQVPVQQKYLDARTAGEKRAAAGEAADLRASLVKNANDWNGLYQWVAIGGGAATAAGIGALIGGIVLVASSGDPPDEPVAAVPVEEEEEESDR